MRLYLVQERKEGEYDLPNHKELIVEANSPAQAIRSVVGDRFTAKAASAKDVARVMAQEYAATKGGSQ